MINFKNIRNKKGLLIRYDIYKNTILLLNNLLKKKFKITYLFNYENIFFLYLIKELFSELK